MKILIQGILYRLNFSSKSRIVIRKSLSTALREEQDRSGEQTAGGASHSANVTKISEMSKAEFVTDGKNQNCSIHFL